MSIPFLPQTPSQVGYHRGLIVANTSLSPSAWRVLQMSTVRPRCGRRSPGRYGSHRGCAAEPLTLKGNSSWPKGVGGFKSALATPYSSAWTRPRLKSLRAYRDGSLRRSSVRLSDGVTTSVERCRLRSAGFPVALLDQSQNRTTERRRSPAIMWKRHRYIDPADPGRKVPSG